MKRIWTSALVAAAFAGTWAGAGLGFAASGGIEISSQDERRELKERFEERYRRVVRAKADEKIGETFDGYLAPLATAFTEEDSELAQLIRAENEDRERLYELLAGEVKDEVDEPERERVTPEIVAERNARRNFRNAKDGEFLRMEDGVWVQKRDEDAYDAILDLKREGDVREGDDGYLSLADDGDAADRSTIDTENDRRRDMFDAIAKAADTEATAIAREHAKEHESRVESSRQEDDDER